MNAAHKSLTPLDYKTVHYASDGTGRDSYVCRNNGGFFKNSLSLLKKNSYSRP